eukprot:2332480-Ditylum_brightwellii.AAC.1
MIEQRAINQEHLLRDSKKKHVYLHMRYHPDNVPSNKFQCAWRKKVDHPKFRCPHTSLRNCISFPLDTGRMVVVYSRPLNLGNILSYRRVDACIDPPS